MPPVRLAPPCVLSNLVMWRTGLSFRDLELRQRGLDWVAKLWEFGRHTRLRTAGEPTVS